MHLPMWRGCSSAPFVALVAIFAVFLWVDSPNDRRSNGDLIVEGDGAPAFVRSCQGLAIRVAKAVNRVFDGWRTVAPAHGPPMVAAARTWLARVGWLRHGRIGVNEAPRLEARPLRR